MKNILVILILVISNIVRGDIYLHNPRGSNNRLDEATRERANGNNNFDSQNNDRGGYNVGSLYYYQGSTISVEWTNQHSCNNPNNHCELILQYMCADTVRDGATTQ
ncbi:protein DD3-3-like [Physella acuta]|uniref:protein DD3-3-like n=1 Tax=Physella acuta TaxID=109671 RepID=UPI0027DD8BE0|nr:protein DD3-3-like [Physella acuta]XP_059178753.1 protein DD3-3-like [Physella acuta]XP_059178761.1 protein DD3-3-like [Physella acuta]XP_059178771.1 protein DD3-3-like [Physella acuta]